MSPENSRKPQRIGLNEAFSKYHRVGMLRGCNEKGCGYVDQQFVNISACHFVIKSMTDFEGKYVAYALGGRPYDYKNKKRNWKKSVVRWIPLEWIEGFSPEDGTEEFRGKLSFYFENLKIVQALELLKGDWYQKLWKREAKQEPVSPLQALPELKDSLKNSVYRLESFKDLASLFEAVSTSYWYTSNGKRIDPFMVLGIDLCQLPGNTFWVKPGDEKLEGLKQDYWHPHLDGFLCHSQNLNAVSLDLEANQRDVFQIACCWDDDHAHDTDSSGLSKVKLQAVIDEANKSVTGGCWVGHNLVAWDWPCLMRKDVELPDAAPVWDTLLMGWLLEPWKRSHALVVESGAHNALTDAEATLQLFRSQLAKLREFHMGVVADMSGLLTHILNISPITEDVGTKDVQAQQRPGLLHHKFPESPRLQSGQSLLASLNQIRDYQWQIGVRIVDPSGRLDTRDPVVRPGPCEALAHEKSDIWLTLLAIVLRAADAQGVEIRLSMIPPYILDSAKRESLRARLVENQDAGVPSVLNAVGVLIIDSFDLEELLEMLRDPIFHAPDPVYLLWMALSGKYKPVATVDLKQRFGDIPPNLRSGALFVRREDQKLHWFRYDPPGLGEPGGLWNELPSLEGMGDMGMNISGERVKPIYEIWTPRWREVNLPELDCDWMFIDPDTANRRIYLQDLLVRLLNLLRTESGDCIWVFALKYAGEAKWIQQKLTLLEVSVDHSERSLHQLQNLLKKDRKVLVCAREDLSLVLEDAKELKLSCRVILDEVPLLDWIYLTQSFTGMDAATNQVAEDSWDRVPMTKRALRPAVRLNLAGWLNALTPGFPETLLSVGILDTRLSSISPGALSNLIDVRDVEYDRVEGLLSDEQLVLFRDWCTAPAASKDVTCSYDDLEKVLIENWGYKTGFLALQQAAVHAIAETDKDILLRLPTGAGKSVVFQIPALWFGEKTGKLTVVVSPLRALMKDQVEGLNRKRFVDSVDYLSGGRDPLENKAVYQGMLDGRIKLVYTAPERFRLKKFTEVLERRRAMDGGLQFIVMDEAHCVSEWGYEFRPDYLFAANTIREWMREEDLVGGSPRILALSATVTEKNREDLQRELGLGLTTGEVYHDLPEHMPHPIQDFIILNSVVAHASDDPAYDEKLDWICARISELDIQKSALVIFARRRRDCFNVAEFINETANQSSSPIQGCRAAPFHAGIGESSKAEIVEGFRSGEIHVLVCTKAFGMGMDIGHIHHCIHLTPPTFIEDYLQEVGRIGRNETLRLDADRKQVTADLLYTEQEIEDLKELLEMGAVKPAFVSNLHAWILEHMIRPVEGEPALCLIPANLGSPVMERPDETKLSQGLFWLERMEALQIEGRFPPTFELLVSPSLLKSWLENTESDLHALSLARFIQAELSPVRSEFLLGSKDPDSKKNQKLFSMILKGLKAGLLSLFGESLASPPVAEPVGNLYQKSPDIARLQTPLRKILSECTYSSEDDIFSAILDLIRDNVLTLDRELKAKLFHNPSGEEFWALLDFVLKRLSRETDGRTVHEDIDKLMVEILSWYDACIRESVKANKIALSDAAIKSKVLRESKRAVWSAIFLLRSAGAEIEERSNQQGKNHIIRAFSNGGQARIFRQVEENIRQAKALKESISLEQDGEVAFIPLQNALGLMSQNKPHTELMNCLAFMKKAGLFQWEGDTQEWNTLVLVKKETELPAYSESWQAHENIDDLDGEALEQQQFREMEQRQAIRKLRALCMHLLCVLPEELKREFIDQYFASSSKEVLENLLTQYAGEILENASDEIQALLVQARQERFTNDYDSLNDGQKRICSLAVQQHLMVNAGPGSGKTKVLTMRCAHLIHRQGVPPNEILVLAFNRAVVSEIKERVQNLFRELGYGGFARRLNVFTFHSFALRHVPDMEKFDDDGISVGLQHFSQSMLDDAYASNIAKNYQTVLVDEFQDMNRDFYTVVSQLVRHCRGGGMVIGDDDQDILGWNRRQAPFEAVEFFEKFRQDFSPQEDELLQNYRSTPAIVDAANRNIDKSSEKIGFVRIKHRPLFTKNLSGGNITRLRVNDRDDADTKILKSLQPYMPDLLEEMGDVAVLCRTNSECFYIRNMLRNRAEFADITMRVLGQVDYSLFQLRETATLLDVCGKRDAFQFVEQHVWNEILEDVKDTGLPDYSNQVDHFHLIYETVRRELGRIRFRDLIDFLMETKTSDLARLEQKHFGKEDSKRRGITISTMHKVKGLEFDTVIIDPSFSDFGYHYSYRNKKQLPTDELKKPRAEEAHLFYVAMTRAQTNLHLFFAPRFWDWFSNGKAFLSPNVTLATGFSGELDEMKVSWSAFIPQHNLGLQKYIQDNVCAGDSVRFQGNRDLVHRERVIAKFSDKGFEMLNAMRRVDPNPKLHVDAVLRYSCGVYYQTHHQEYYKMLHDDVKKQGWFYTVSIRSN